MAGAHANLADPFGDKRQRFEGMLEFGTHEFSGQIAYAKDPGAVLYDRREKVARSMSERARKRIPARSPNRE